MDIKIITPKSASEIEDGRRLGYEYVETIGNNPVLKPYFKNQNFFPEIDKMPKGFEAPDGAYLVAYVDDEPAGTISMKRLDNAICEMKRLYVRPKFQGLGLGKRLTEQLIAEAKRLNYIKMRLDNSKTVMAKANKLYESMGFYEIESYNNNFVKDAFFMEKLL
jgi:ribosomal protein S18 acetylase RimI-like enzyme